jgi:nitrate reductase assembly molybdenum cofactor insertion protein NarJ
MSKRLELFDKLITGGSSDPFHHYARAMELRSLGQAEAALQGFSAACAQFPDYVPSYLMAAQLAQELGQPAAARSHASAGVEAAKRAGNEHALSELTALLDALPA